MKNPQKVSKATQLEISLFKIFKFATTKPKMILISFFVLMGLSFYFMTHLKLLFVVDDLIEPEFKTYKSLKTLQSDFFIRNSVLFTYTSSLPRMTHQEMCLIDLWAQEMSSELNTVQATFSGTRLRQIKWNESKRHLGFPLVFPADECKTSLANRPVERIKTPWQNIIYSQSGKDISIEFQLKETESDFFFGGFDPQVVADIRSHFTQFQQKHNLRGESHWSGNGSFQYFMKKALDRGNVLNGLIVVVIILLFKLFWGTFRSSFLYLLTLVISSILLHGFIGLFRFPIDILSNSLFIMLAISCVEDFVFLSHFKASYPEKDWSGAFRKILLPSFFTSLTTIIGFGSLAISELSIISRFGIMAALGALIEWFVMFTFLPALLTLFPSMLNWVRPNKKNSAFARWAENAGRYRPHRALTMVSLLVFPLALWSFSKIEVNDSPESVFADTHPVQKSMDYIFQERGWKADISLLIHEPSEDLSARVDALISESPMIKEVESFERVSAFYTQSVAGQASLIQLVKNRLEETPFAMRLISPRVDRINLFVDDLSVTSVEKLRQKVNNICKNEECELGGSLVSFSEFAQKVPKTLLQSLLMSLFLVILVVGVTACFFQTRRQWWIILLSALWGPAAIVGLIYILQTPITYITCIFASVLIGLAGDNALQYIFSSRDQSLDGGISSCELASIKVAVVMVLLPSAFYLGTFQPMKILGFLFSLGALASLIGDLWVLKGLNRNS